MGRRHVVRDLDDEQFQYVINAIIAGMTDREVAVAFQAQFASPLSKSALNRWRQAAGNELVERYRLARYQASKLLEDLGEKKDANKFQVVISNLEDKLLTATREVIASDPVKMLQLRLDEEKRRLKERELEIKEKQLDLEIAKTKALSRESLPSQILESLLEFIGQDPVGLKWFSSQSKKLEKFLTDKYAA